MSNDDNGQGAGLTDILDKLDKSQASTILQDNQQPYTRQAD
jgi:hypothetical protein